MGLYSDRFFPWLIDKLEGPEVYELRKQCVAPATGHVLEIGFGTGKTLPYYGDAVTRLSIVEPSTGMNLRTEALLSSARFETDVLPLKGEQLPFENETFDSAVCTMTLCSVDDVSAVLGEIHRTLKSGGSFYFLEHVRSADESTARKQRWMNPIQRVIGCGCNLTRDTHSSIDESGLVIEKLERVISADMPGFSPTMFPLIVGAARKPS